MWNWPNTPDFGTVVSCDGETPVVKIAVRFHLRPRTELPVWNRCYHEFLHKVTLSEMKFVK